MILNDNNNNNKSYLNTQEHLHNLFLCTDTNLEDNEHWGDLMNTKQDNTIRIYFQNINELKLTQSWDKWRSIVTEINKRNVDIAGFVKTNINWNPIREMTAKPILRKMFWNG